MEETEDEFVHEYFLAEPGPRPPCREVADHLWGKGCDFDSDGNSEPDPATAEWTELTIILRPEGVRRIDIDPIVDEDHAEIRPLVLIITSQDEGLARSAAHFLHDHCGGRLTRGPGGPETAGRGAREAGAMTRSAYWLDRFRRSLPE